MAATGANPVSLEGDLRVRLVLAPGRIRHVAITSTRPDVAQRLLQVRRRADVQAAVPLLFSVCGRSQATAAGLACAAAAGEAPSAIALAQARRGVAAEMLREAAWLCLLQWPQRLGEAPSADGEESEGGERSSRPRSRNRRRPRRDGEGGESGEAGGSDD